MTTTPAILIFEPVLGSFSASRALGMAIWIGLAVLTVSLLVVMRTRWGQTQPLSKCVVLSIFAHILLLAYASGTRLVFDVPAAHQEQVIRLALVAPDREPRPELQEPREPQPWEQPETESPTTPDPISPAPSPATVELPDLEAAAAPPAFEMAAAQLPEPVSVIEHPLPETTPTTEVLSHAPAPSNATPETPDSMRAIEAEPLVPVSAPLDRLPVQPDTTPTGDSVPENKPLEDLLQQDLIQRLTDIPVASELADALPASLDLTAAASNREELHASTSRHGSERQESDASAGAQMESAAASAAAPKEMRRLGDGEPLPPTFQLRMARQQLSLIERHGGNAQTEQAVEAALRWLAANQDADGRWNPSRFGAGLETKVLGHDRQGAGANADTGISGLALLAFLAAGHTHFEGEYRRTVQHGLEFLLSEQASDGNLTGNASLFARMYCHGIASLAVCEAYAMTGDHRLRPYVERAVQYTIHSQHPTTGGWRYQPHDQGDTSQFGWQVMALHSAELAGIPIPGETRSGMLRFLRRVSKGQHGGLAAYRPSERPSPTMTAEALTCRFLLGTPEPPVLDEAVTALLREPPTDGKANLYYWYYATLALYQAQGDDWRRWNESLQQQLLARQRHEGSFAGSWDPDTVWGGYGGRVYSTAMATLCLEVYYRYLSVY